MRMIAMRHAEYDFPMLEEQRGREGIEPPLNTVGRVHARRVGREMKDRLIKAVYSSPTPRARETAEIACKKIGLEPNFLTDLQSVGSFGRIAAKYLQSAGPDFFHQWLRGELEVPEWPPFEELVTRAKRAIQTIQSIQSLQSPSDTVLVVTHGEMIKALQVAVGGDPSEVRRRPQVANCEMCEFDI